MHGAASMHAWAGGRRRRARDRLDLVTRRAAAAGCDAMHRTAMHGCCCMLHAPSQLPIGSEDTLCGLVDLIRMEAVYFDGDHGVAGLIAAMLHTLGARAAHA